MWSLTLKEEHRIMVSENRVLRGIFKPNRDKVTNECIKLNNEKLHNLYASPNTVTMIKSRSIK
jgi:hypothetical protein